MIPTLSQVCSLNAPFGADVEDYAAGQCHSIEVWMTKLETYLESNSIDDVMGLVDDHGIQLPVASYHGGLLDSHGEKRQLAWEHFETRLELCQRLQIGTFVVACDVSMPLSQRTIDHTIESLKLVADAAAQRNVRVALEFQGRSALGNNLQTAAGIVEQIHSPNLGLCFDLMQFYLGPSKFHDLQLLDRQNLYHVQLADLADVARELATDSDRILPGDGDFHVQPIVDHLRAIDYQGCVSVEIMNPRIWNVPPRQFGEIAMTALRKQLGLAS